MTDKIMEDIKSGKGLPPLSGNNDSTAQPGMTTEQRADQGITYEKFVKRGGNESDKNE